MADVDNKKSIQERVESICNQFLRDGTKLSVRLVLAELPDVSSTSTVHKYFKDWKLALESSQQSLYEKLGFSPEFTQGFMKEIKRFGVEAEQRYKDQARDAGEQRDIAIDDLERVENKLEVQNAVASRLEKEVKELQDELSKLRVISESESKKAAELAQASLNKEKETHIAIVTELRKQLDYSTEKVNSLTQSNEMLRTDIAKAELKLEGNQEYVNEVKSQNAALLDENKKLASEGSNLSKVVAGHESTIRGDQRLITSLESTVGDLKRQFTEIDKERNTLSNNNQSLSQDLSAANKTLTGLNEQLERANLSVSELRKTTQEQSAVITKLTT